MRRYRRKGEAHLPFLRRYLPFRFGAPGGRWPTASFSDKEAVAGKSNELSSIPVSSSG